MRRFVLACGATIGVTLASAQGVRITMVACAPGFPGTTRQAQPSMDAFAEHVEGRAGIAAGRLRAEYYESLAPGLARLGQDDVRVALVPLPFWLEYRETLRLEPFLEVEGLAGAEEIWSLVAASGKVADATELSGWQLAGTPAYSERFVRNVALDGWGPLPGDVEIRFTARVLSDLRRAAAGEPIAVLLDRAQTDALASLPDPSAFTIVRSSPPLPSSLACSVGGRLDEDDRRAIRDALLALERDDPGREALETIRVRRFRPLRDDLLAAAVRAFSR